MEKPTVKAIILQCRALEKQLEQIHDQLLYDYPADHRQNRQTLMAATHAEVARVQAFAIANCLSTGYNLDLETGEEHLPITVAEDESDAEDSGVLHRS